LPRKQKQGSAGPVARGTRRQVAPGDLQPNPWNPNEMDDVTRDKVRASLAQFGQVAEILVRQVGPDNPPAHGQRAEPGLEIINGEHRWQEACVLGMTAVDVRDLGVVSDQEAKQITVVLNGLTGSPDPNLLGALVEELVASEGIDALEAVLPYSAAELEGLAKLSVADPYFAATWAERVGGGLRPDGVPFVWKDSGKVYLPVSVGTALIKEFDRIAGRIASRGSRDVAAVLAAVAATATTELIDAAWDRVLDDEEEPDAE
jgi:hypothetical protein